MTRQNIIYLLYLFISMASPGMAAAAWDCPEDLRPASETYRKELQENEYAVKNSSYENSVRVEPTSIFDLAAHECHTGRAQYYRIFGPGDCSPAEKPGIYKVVYPYVLYFRREKTEEAMFRQDWKEGTDGLWQATFEKAGGNWAQIGQREVLDLKGPGGKR